MLLLFGTIFSNISVSKKMKANSNFETHFININVYYLLQCRLIVAQMSDTRADAWNHLLWLILIVTGISVVPWNQFGLPTIDDNVEIVLVYFLTSVATLTHLHYGQGVVSAIFHWCIEQDFIFLLFFQ